MRRIIDIGRGTNSAMPPIMEISAIKAQTPNIARTTQAASETKLSSVARADLLADGSMDEGVLIEDFHLGGNNFIETLAMADGYSFDLTVFV